MGVAQEEAYLVAVVGGEAVAEGAVGKEEEDLEKLTGWKTELGGAGAEG